MIYNVKPTEKVTLTFDHIIIYDGTTLEDVEKIKIKPTHYYYTLFINGVYSGTGYMDAAGTSSMIYLNVIEVVVNGNTVEIRMVI